MLAPIGDENLTSGETVGFVSESARALLGAANSAGKDIE